MDTLSRPVVGDKSKLVLFHFEKYLLFRSKVFPLMAESYLKNKQEVLKNVSRVKNGGKFTN